MSSFNEMQAQVNFLGKVIFQSRMLGMENEWQGKMVAVMMLMCGINPLWLLFTHHIIGGKLSVRADAALATFIADGGKIRVVERTPERVCIVGTAPNGTEYESSITWAEAQNEDFIYKGKRQAICEALRAGKRESLTIEDKWLHPRSRMQHLTARCVTDMLRVLWPAAVVGRYSPIETSSFTGYPMPTIVDGVHPEEIAQIVAAVEHAGEAEQSTAVTAESTKLVEPLDTKEQLSAEPIFSQVSDGLMTQQQLDRLRELISEVTQVVPTFFDTLKSKLQAAGLKLADLSVETAKQIEIAARQRELKALADLTFASPVNEGNEQSSTEQSTN